MCMRTERISKYIVEKEVIVKNVSPCGVEFELQRTVGAHDF